MSDVVSTVEEEESDCTVALSLDWLVLRPPSSLYCWALLAAAICRQQHEGCQQQGWVHPWTFVARAARPTQDEQSSKTLLVALKQPVPWHVAGSVLTSCSAQHASANSRFPGPTCLSQQAEQL